MQIRETLTTKCFIYIVDRHGWWASKPFWNWNGQACVNHDPNFFFLWRSGLEIFMMLLLTRLNLLKVSLDKTTSIIYMFDLESINGCDRMRKNWWETVDCKLIEERDDCILLLWIKLVRSSSTVKRGDLKKEEWNGAITRRTNLCN